MHRLRLSAVQPVLRPFPALLRPVQSLPHCGLPLLALRPTVLVPIGLRTPPFVVPRRAFHSGLSLRAAAPAAAPVAVSSGEFDVRALVDGVSSGDRLALSRAITLVESTRPDHRKLSHDLMTALLARPPYRPPSHASSAFRPPGPSTLRIGISGPPGVGKSTLIEALGSYLVAERGHRVAVLSIDPSSARSGGSLLGDKTRMTRLTRMADAYVRPSPSRGVLGGVGSDTSEAIVLCERAGYDVVLVETVGVGQSETAVRDCVDMVVLLVAPGGGDELQGMKKGIVELADAVVVHKADGPLMDLARHTKVEYLHALQMLRPDTATGDVLSPTARLRAERQRRKAAEAAAAGGDSNNAATAAAAAAAATEDPSAAVPWSVPVLLCSSRPPENEAAIAATNAAMSEVWQSVLQFRQAHAGVLEARRGEQRTRWMLSAMSAEVGQRLHEAVCAEDAPASAVTDLFARVQRALQTGATTPRTAAHAIVDEWIKQIRSGN